MGPPSLPLRCRSRCRHPRHRPVHGAGAVGKGHHHHRGNAAVGQPDHSGKHQPGRGQPARPRADRRDHEHLLADVSGDSDRNYHASGRCREGDFDIHDRRDKRYLLCPAREQPQLIRQDRRPIGHVRPRKKRRDLYRSCQSAAVRGLRRQPVQRTGAICGSDAGSVWQRRLRNPHAVAGRPLP